MGCNISFRILALALAIAGTSTPAVLANLVPIAPFTGQFTEDWESFPTTNSSETRLPNPSIIMGGAATIHSAYMTTWETGPNTIDLGTSGRGRVADGVRAMSLGGMNRTGIIDFSIPVSSFGAFWGACTGGITGSPAYIQVAFYDSNGVLVASDTFSYVRPGDGILEWHGWFTTEPASRVTYTEDVVTVDGLQASHLPEPQALSLLIFGLSVLPLGRSFAAR